MLQGMTDTATRSTPRAINIAAGISTLIAALGLFLGAFSDLAEMAPWIVGIGAFFGLITLAVYFFTKR